MAADSLWLGDLKRIKVTKRCNSTDSGSYGYPWCNYNSIIGIRCVIIPWVSFSTAYIIIGKGRNFVLFG